MTRNMFIETIRFSAILVVSIIMAGATHAQNQAGIAADTGLTDAALLGLAGTWTGTYTMGDESGPAELEWKKAISGQWLQGTMRFWRDRDKSTLVYDELLFLRPAGAPGEYKGYTVDNFGVGQVAKGNYKDGLWNWTWNYDDGHVEKGIIDSTDPNKTIYNGKVVDKDGKPAGAFALDLTKAE